MIGQGQVLFSLCTVVHKLSAQMNGRHSLSSLNAIQIMVVSDDIRRRVTVRYTQTTWRRTDHSDHGK